MKKYYLLILLVIPAALFAQKKVDLDRFNFKVQFRSLPDMRLDSSYRTYNVSVSNTRLMQPFMKGMEPANTVLLDGWKKLPKDGHINIDIKLEDLLPESVTVKERIVNVTNKSGVVTGTSKLYYQEVVYTFAATDRKSVV